GLVVRMNADPCSSVFICGFVSSFWLRLCMTSKTAAEGGLVKPETRNAGRRWSSVALWSAVSMLGAGALGAIALARNEPINAMWIIVAAVCVYLIGYRFYSRFIAVRVMELDSARATPAERLDDGRDSVPTNKWVVFGHHFAAMAGPGPLVGPTLAAQL